MRDREGANSGQEQALHERGDDFNFEKAGETAVRYRIGDCAAALAATGSGRSGDAGRGAGRNWHKQIRLLASLALLIVATAAMLLSPGALEPAQAQRLLQVSGAKRTTAVTVAVGKTEDVRIDAAFTDITIGDSDVADISPLTDRTLSILGKRIGTTRVTLYGEGKMQIGIFDIEVTYDVTRLAAELNRFSSGIKVSSVNGRVILSGIAHDASTLDKAMRSSRASLRLDAIDTVTVQIMQPQQVMLEVRFVEASPAGRARPWHPVEFLQPEHACQHRQREGRLSANCRSRPNGGQANPRFAARRDRHLVRSGAASAFLLGAMNRGGLSDRRGNHMRWRRRASIAQPRRAQPGGALRRHRELPCRRRRVPP